MKLDNRRFNQGGGVFLSPLYPYSKEGTTISIKGKLAMTAAVAFMGLSFIVGGSYAYFADTKATDSIISNGTLDLGLDKETIIEIENMAPGDTVEGDIEISNNGNVDIGEVLLHSSYEVIDHGTPNNGDDLGDHIQVEVIHQGTEENTVIFEKRLSQLTENPELMMDGFPTDREAETFLINLTFVDNGEDQNHFQADEMQIKWDFEGVQRDGDASSSSGTYAFFSDQSSVKGELDFAEREQEKHQNEEQGEPEQDSMNKQGTEEKDEALDAEKQETSEKEENEQAPVENNAGENGTEEEEEN